MDFLELIDPDQGVEIAGRWIGRARLGRHLRLARLADEIKAALQIADAAQAAASIRKYLAVAGVAEARLTMIGVELLLTYSRLVELNAFRTIFAFQTLQGSTGQPPMPEPPYTYPGRVWAWWIHKLASRYGWDRRQIFQLWPEEAAAYLQEILISEYDEADEARALSELAYHYDRSSMKARFIPLPRPAWMKDAETKPSSAWRIRRDMLPIGTVIDLTHKTNEDFIIH